MYLTVEEVYFKVSNRELSKNLNTSYDMTSRNDEQGLSGW